jgi:hypothetical protein
VIPFPKKPTGKADGLLLFQAVALAIDKAATWLRLQAFDLGSRLAEWSQFVGGILA